MHIKNAVTVALLVLAFSVSVSYGQSTSLITHYSVLNNWIPVIFIAIMLSMMIAGIYYMIGVIVGNSGIKSNAISEFGQAVGTAIIVAILLGVFYIIANGFSTTSLFSPSIPASICANFLSGSPLTLSNSVAVQSPTNTICSFIDNVNSGGSSSYGTMTTQLDYPLAASYVIIANLTNQTIVNLNSLYLIESYIGFLSKFSPYINVCIPAGDILVCTLPITPVPFAAKFSFTPLAGYSLVRKATVPLEVVALLSFESFVMQLLVMSLVLFTWPYILAAGIILRSTFLTRRIGGLLMAIAIAAFGIFPAISLIEYAALSGGAGTSSPIGANVLPTLQIHEQNFIGQNVIYASNTLNFYVLPHISWVANYYKCWQGNTVGAEVGFAWPYLIPGYSVYIAIMEVVTFSFASSIPAVSTSCTANEISQMIPNIINVYGVTDVAGFVLPVLNILVVLASLKGLSQVFGGDTNLLGIGKLV